MVGLIGTSPLVHRRLEQACMVAYRVRYSGQVQGVYFRATAQEYAREYGLDGTVRNLPDGSVELFVQGAPQVVTAFLADVAARFRGNIEGEARELSEPAADLKGFDVLRS
jgi:acylphosphatase